MSFSYKKMLLSSFFLFTSLVSYSAKLLDVSYKNGEFNLTFDSKVSHTSMENSKITSANNTTYIVNEINMKDSSIDDDVLRNIKINDQFYKRIIIDNIDSNNIGIYTYSQFGYTSNVTFKGNVITIKQMPTKVPKRISPLTKKQLVIVLDAGHGGHDSGARGHGKLEKDIALEVVKKLADNLKRDHKIILTRSDDTFVTLSERAQIGNRNAADLFVSIHLNASSNSSANGAEIFYFSKETNPYTAKLIAFEETNDNNNNQRGNLLSQILGDFFVTKTREKSAKLAEVILDNYIDTLDFRRRGVFGANFAVLRGSESASMLIELGFITNESDNIKLASNSGQISAVNAIADAIRENFEE